MHSAQMKNQALLLLWVDSWYGWSGFGVGCHDTTTVAVQCCWGCRVSFFYSAGSVLFWVLSYVFNPEPL